MIKPPITIATTSVLDGAVILSICGVPIKTMQIASAQNLWDLHELDRRAKDINTAYTLMMEKTNNAD